MTSPSLLGIVEAERLGDLVGGPTRGTNGGANAFNVAGGHGLRWTGMDVRKKDGSPTTEWGSGPPSRSAAPSPV